MSRYNPDSDYEDEILSQCSQILRKPSPRPLPTYCTVNYMVFACSHRDWDLIRVSTCLTCADKRAGLVAGLVDPEDSFCTPLSGPIDYLVIICPLCAAGGEQPSAWEEYGEDISDLSDWSDDLNVSAVTRPSLHRVLGGYCDEEDDWFNTMPLYPSDAHCGLYPDTLSGAYAPLGSHPSMSESELSFVTYEPVGSEPGEETEKEQEQEEETETERGEVKDEEGEEELSQPETPVKSPTAPAPTARRIATRRASLRSGGKK